MRRMCEERIGWVRGGRSDFSEEGGGKATSEGDDWPPIFRACGARLFLALSVRDDILKRTVGGEVTVRLQRQLIVAHPRGHCLREGEGVGERSHHGRELDEEEGGRRGVVAGIWDKEELRARDEEEGGRRCGWVVLLGEVLFPLGGGG